MLLGLSRLTSVVDAYEPLRVAWREALWAFAPLSFAVLWFALRGVALARGWLLVVAGYVLVSCVVLMGATEWGAYLLPLALPAAWITVSAIGARASLARVASPVAQMRSPALAATSVALAPDGSDMNGLLSLADDVADASEYLEHHASLTAVLRHYVLRPRPPTPRMMCPHPTSAREEGLRASTLSAQTLQQAPQHPL